MRPAMLKWRGVRVRRSMRPRRATFSSVSTKTDASFVESTPYTSASSSKRRDSHVNSTSQ